MPILNLTISAIANILLFGGLPLLGFFVFHERRHGWSSREAAKQAGLQLGPARHIGVSLVIAALLVVAVIAAGSSIDAAVGERSAFARFRGLGLNPTSIGMALIYGVLATGFAEELLFRGLIAGSLARRLSLPVANLGQALIFLAPHALVLTVAPELWPMLVVIFVVSLLVGWVRISSGSIVGPWIVHAAGNVTMAIMAATHPAS
jgi:membrane protease YdiL (CAAX protease family)